MNLLAPLKVSDQAREDRLAAQAEARVRDARAAMEALQQRRTQASDERKAAAKQKIEQLKARLQALQSMAAADPRGTARLAAQLARELKAAVKEYSGGGGGFGSIGGGPDTAVPTPTTEAAPAVATPSPPETAAPMATPASTTASGPDAGTDAGEQDPDGEEGEKPANPYQQAIDQQQARAAEFNRRTAEARADQEFIGEARKLAAQIKSLVRNAADRSPGEEGALSPEEARELKAAVADMDRQMDTAQGDLGGSISILV